MRRGCLIFFFCSFVIFAKAQPSFPAASIPESLKKNAHSVKREEKIELDIKSPGKAFYKVHTVVTVLDEGGSDELTFEEYTDKFISLEEAEIKVFDANGNPVKKYTKKDMASQVAGEGLVPDGKIYYLKVPSADYPVTVQFDYELKYNGLLDYPDYEIQYPEQSIENATFSARVPTDIDLRLKLKGTLVAADIAADSKTKSYSWSFKNIPALEFQEGSVSRESRYPRIILAPNKFELDGYAGDMSSWQNFGKWYAMLAKDAINLPEDKKLYLQSLVKDAQTEREKIKIIYTYLQQNFRYVSIQLGIGGFKPFEAAFVDKKKYGDCKALSNYTQACLAAIGIKSYQALINAGYNKEPVDPDFTNNTFNHVILCVPFQKDSVWLECTSSTNDFGVLGNFTENRNALLIKEDGGKLVATPKSKASDNLFFCNTIVSLTEDGSGKATTTLKCTGEYKQDFVHYISNEKKDDQKQFMVAYLGFTQPDEFELTNDKNDSQAETTIKMSIEKIPDFSAGSKMFLNPRIYKLWQYSLPKAENRTQDFYFEHPLIKTDTTIYQLPQGFVIETLPKGKNLQFEYGSYITDYRFDETKKTITTTARLVLNEYKIPAAKFLATKKFFSDVLAEYAEKIVIKRL